MSMTDPIADMLTRVRNALKARFQKVDVPASKLKTEVARILKDEGYILNYKIVDDGAHKAIRVYLKYNFLRCQWPAAKFPVNQCR